MYMLGPVVGRLGCIGSSLDSKLYLSQGLARVPGLLLYCIEYAFFLGLESLLYFLISVYCIRVLVEYLLDTSKPLDIFGVSRGFC